MSLVRTFIRNILKHDIFTLAASLAYTTAVALAPFLIVLFSMAGYLTSYSQDKVVDEFKSLFGSQVGDAIRAIMQRANQHPDWRGFAGLFGFAVLFVSASAIFSQLQTELDKINEYEPPRSDTGIGAIIKSKLFSIGLVFGFAFLLITSLFLSSLVSLAIPSAWTALITMPAHFIFFTVVFSAIFHYCPSQRAHWQKSLESGVLASVFFLIGRYLLGIYFSKAAFDSVYGAAGSLIIFLVWSYYSSFTLLLSYELAHQTILKNDSREATA